LQKVVRYLAALFAQDSLQSEHTAETHTFILPHKISCDPSIRTNNTRCAGRQSSRCPGRDISA